MVTVQCGAVVFSTQPTPVLTHTVTVQCGAVVFSTQPTPVLTHTVTWLRVVIGLSWIDRHAEVQN